MTNVTAITVTYSGKLSCQLYKYFIPCSVLCWGQDGRLVVTKPFSSGAPAGKGQQEAGPDRGGDGPAQGAGRGHRKQLTVTMAGKKVHSLLCQCLVQAANKTVVLL